MHVRTDDEVYRVDSVWLGPPRATFPWRVRYVGYGVGLLVMIVVMFAQRRVGIGLDFFSVAWALVITVAITRFIGSRINYERPLGQVLEMFRYELTGPRRRTGMAGGPVRVGHVRVRSRIRLTTNRGRRAGSKRAHTRPDPWSVAAEASNRAAARPNTWTITGDARTETQPAASPAAVAEALVVVWPSTIAQQTAAKQDAAQAKQDAAQQEALHEAAEQPTGQETGTQPTGWPALESATSRGRRGGRASRRGRGRRGPA